MQRSDSRVTVIFELAVQAIDPRSTAIKTPCSSRRQSRPLPSKSSTAAGSRSSPSAVRSGGRSWCCAGSHVPDEVEHLGMRLHAQLAEHKAPVGVEAAPALHPVALGDVWLDQAELCSLTQRLAAHR